jgi:hypothetical protein
MCRSGSESTACGASGASCAVCGAGSQCSFGACGNQSGSTGGGSAGGGGGGGAGGGTATAITDWRSYCQAASTVFSAFSVRCGQYTAQGGPALARQYLSLCSAAPPPGVSDGRTRFDAARAQACLDRAQATSCQSGLPSGCADILVGLVPLNGTCFESFECVSGWCDTSASCPGRCVPRVGLGQPVPTNGVCVDGAYEYQNVCAALVPMGQSCAPTGGSTRPRSCLDGECINGVCGPRPLDLTVGQACLPNQSPECHVGLQCVGGACVALSDVNGPCDSARRCKNDLVCGPANACIRRGALGATCGTNQPCDERLFCNRASGASTGTCQPVRQAGESCTGFLDCDYPTLYCTVSFGPTTGVCRVRGDVSAPCTLDVGSAACREGLYCTATSTSPSGVCANLKSVGATCADPDECESRRCTSGRCAAPSFCQDPTP